MKKRILSLLLTFLMLFSMFPAYSTYAVETEKEVSVWYFNSVSEAMEEADAVELYRGGELYLSAILRDDISGEIQWQIEANQDSWVDIQGGTAEDLRVSYGMVQSLLGNDSVRMRCTVLGDKEYYSDPFTVVVTDVDNRLVTDTFNIEREQAAPDPLPAPVGIPNTSQETEPVVTEETVSIVENAVPLASASTPRIMLLSAVNTTSTGTQNEDVTYYTVTIEYVYGDSSKFAGQRVALPYIAEVAAGDTLSETVTSPSCVGYLPDISSINLADLGEINTNKSLTVEYSPAEVSYTVRHYLQNVDNDEYTWVDTTMVSGYTEALTSDNAAKTYTGFTALSHYHEEIAADSSTMIDIYYDRNYYLMSFNLDGGYGVEAVYARFGADISVSDPQRAGYSFNGWSPAIPSTMPAGNTSYTALWTPDINGVKYTVVYWLQDANTPTQYNYWASRDDVALAETEIDGADDIDEKLPSEVSLVYVHANLSRPETAYYTWNEEKTDQDIVVKGDGSTVVNVYYDRNEYAFKFYYAKKQGDGYRLSNNTGGYGDSDTGTASAGFSNYSYYDEDSVEFVDDFNPYSKGNDGDYYYFVIKARYGQVVSSIWPDAPLKQYEDGVKFVSWATNFSSGYNINNSNPNIKGPYSVLDAQIIIDPAKKSTDADGNLQINHELVAYWGKPNQFKYEIYYSALSNEEGEEYPEGSGKKYVLQTWYPVGSTAGADQQSALTFEGVTYVTSNTNAGSETIDSVSYTVVRFYYSRNNHKVVFEDQYGTSYEYSVAYGETLSDIVTPPKNPEIPAALPKAAYEFGGWYSSPACAEGTEYDGTRVMPDNDLTYYALWTPKIYTVTINDGNGTVLSTEQVNYGSKATKPTDPTMENATFIGWYYKDANNAEQRFDFDNMTITQSMTIYAKWRSEVMKQVEIHYVVENEDGTKTQIADTETLMLRLGQTRTFEAKTGNSLYTEYRTRRFPTTASHSITIEDSHIESSEPVTFTFEYKEYGAVPYQVEFYVLDENDVERPAFKKNAEGKAEFVEYGQWSNDYAAYIEQHWQNDKAVVTELYIPDDLAVSTWTLPDEYLPNALKIQKIIVPSETNPETNIAANTIKFVYTYTEPVVDPDNPDNPDPGTSVYEARYLVQHFIQNSSDTTKYDDLYSYSDEEGLSGETAIASAISIPGYTFSPDVTNEKKQTGTTLGADNTMSGTITADDKLELNFYYTVNSYPYQVMYLEEGNNRVLADAKTEVDEKQLSGLYGSKVTEEAISIDGYDVVGSSTKSIYIQMEAGNTASVNTIVFYYKLKSAELVISKSVELDETQAAQEGISEIPSWVYDQEFEFTVYQSEGYPKSVYHYTITYKDGTTEDKTVNAGVQTIVVSLKHGESIQFHDFPMGTYTVTETYVPGFRTSVDGYIAQAHTVTLDTDGDVGTLHFLNTFPFYTGDLVIKKNVTRLDESDPTATEPYKVTVVLNPDDSSREVDRVITFVDKDGNALTDASNNSSFTIPKLTGTDDQTQFTITLLVPVDGEVKMEGVPVGSFTAEEEVKGTIGYIYDFYTVKYNKAVHENDEVTGTNHVVSGSIHGGHPTAVTFTNTYRKGSLTINKTVTQEYENDNWTSDTFTFTISGTTELPDGPYVVDGATVTVSNGVVTVKDSNGNDPAISITKTDGATSWSGSLTFENLPAGYYTVTETARLGNDKYTAVGPTESLLVNDVNNATVANFTNTYKRHLGTLTINKVVAGTDAKDTFIFHIKGKDEANKHIDMDVTITGTGSVKIHDLPLGNYTVTEDTEWSWRYTASASSQSANLTKNPDATVTFTNTHENGKWLNDTAHMPNVFSKKEDEQEGS